MTNDPVAHLRELASTATAAADALGPSIAKAAEMVRATVAVICVPPEAAQEVADRLVAADVHALLNFAPQVLNVPLGTAVHYVDFSIELQILMYHLNNGTGPLGGGLLHSLGIAATNPLRTP